MVLFRAKRAKKSVLSVVSVVNPARTAASEGGRGPTQVGSSTLEHAIVARLIVARSTELSTLPERLRGALVETKQRQRIAVRAHRFSMKRFCGAVTGDRRVGPALFEMHRPGALEELRLAGGVAGIVRHRQLDRVADVFFRSRRRAARRLVRRQVELEAPEVGPIEVEETHAATHVEGLSASRRGRLRTSACAPRPAF
jgi:hypothetical protein